MPQLLTEFGAASKIIYNFGDDFGGREKRMPLSAGDTLNNRYQIEDVIGRGGYGAVYYAFDSVLQQPCALKENLNATPEAQRQFEREAVILAGLRHTNLPRVFDYFFVAEQGQYLVMDFAEGQSLHEILNARGAPLTEQEALPWIKQVCQALTYLHRQNPPIIHRDIKPQNIIISPQGQAMLVDFGLSKLYGDGQKTSAGAQGVSFGYAPPEQYGPGRTDTRSDVYSLGATLYTMLTGQCPPDAIKRLMDEEKLIPPRHINHHITPQVEQVVLKAMKTTTSERFQSVEAFQQALIQSPPPTVPASRVVVAERDRPRKVPALALIGGGGIMLITLIALAMGMGWFALSPNLSASEETPVIQTPLPAAVFSTSTSTPSPTATFTPSPSATPAQPATSTPDNQVVITISKDMNIRSGPGTNYPIIGEASSGDTSTVTGRNEDNTWFEIEYPPGSGNTGWVFAELVELTGNPDSVAIAQISTPPSATPAEIPITTPTLTPTPEPQFQFTAAAWSTLPSQAVVQLRGAIKDEAGNPVNGYSILADNGSFSVLSHPTGASHHYPEIGDGQWDIVLYDPTTAAGNWTLTVVSYECPNFDQRFDAQCKQFTRLSEDITVRLETPNEAILNADWICHRDCNQGLY